jgi:hypothetical protein
MLKLPNPEQFNFKDVTVFGDECWLITPNHIGVKWTDEDSRFRSCIVRKSDFLCVSQGLPKFKNWSEDPEFQPWDLSWQITAMHKKDGSLIICSYHNGGFIVRTRGVSSVLTQETGQEVLDLFDSFPLLKDMIRSAEGNSFLFEHTTPNRVIVLREDAKPTLTLLAIISNFSARLEQQSYCDRVAAICGIPRPQKYYYNSVQECINDVAAWKGAEGVVLYSPDGNTLKKIKSESYLAAHRLCTGIKTIDHIVDLFLSSGDKFTDPKDFHFFVSSTIDFELAEKIKDEMEKICAAYSNVLICIERVKKVVAGVSGESFSRKEQALEIIQHYDGSWKKNAGFLLLDKKEVSDTVIRKGIEEELNKLAFVKVPSL